MSSGRGRFSKRRKGNFKGKLLRQVLISALILLFIIAIKMMDTAITNKVLKVTQAKILVNHTGADLGNGIKSSFGRLKDGTITMVAAIHDNSRSIEFSDPADGIGSIAASAGGDNAIRYEAKEELQVYAAAGGTVVEILDEDDGKCIRISHGNDLFSVYKGCSKVYIKALEKVRRGQIIGTVYAGDENNLTFEIRAGGKLVNPTDYLKR